MQHDSDPISVHFLRRWWGQATSWPAHNFPPAASSTHRGNISQLNYKTKHFISPQKKLIHCSCQTFVHLCLFHNEQDQPCGSDPSSQIGFWLEHSSKLLLTFLHLSSAPHHQAWDPPNSRIKWSWRETVAILAMWSFSIIQEVCDVVKTSDKTVSHNWTDQYTIYNV